MNNKENDDFNFKDALKYIPGFRSGKRWKSIIAILYYIICLLMIFDEGMLGIFMLTFPFIIFYSIDSIFGRRKDGYNKNSPKIALLAIVVMIVSALLTPDIDNDVAKVESNKSEEVEAEKVEEPKEETKPKIEEEPEEEVFKGERDLKVHFIDVGQGDSIFIELPNGENVLIDGGPGANTHHLIKYLRSLDFHVIDHLVATHPHEDHIGGIPEVTRNWKLGKIYLPGKSHTTKIFEEMLVTFQEKGYSATKTEAGTILVDEPGLSLKAIAPSPDMNGDNLNDYSIVLKLDYNDTSFMFTGDAEAKTENMLVNQDIKVDVLKVGHHGSDTSSTEAFIKKSSPKYSVITCGKDNQYGHPNNVVLDRLKSINSEIYRTDTDGTIIATSDGEKIEFEKKGNPIQPNAPPKQKSSNNNGSGGSSGSSGNQSQPTQQPKQGNSGGGGGGGQKQQVTGQAQGEQVYITPTGSKYHSKPCGGGTYTPVDKQEAINKKLGPCGRCYK